MKRNMSNEIFFLKSSQVSRNIVQLTLDFFKNAKRVETAHI